MTSPLASIQTIISEARDGKMFILVDDERRENEGDLIIPASKITSQAINFMVTHCRGLICLAMSHSEINRLTLPPMTKNNSCKLGTAFTVSIDAKENVSTGISAADRAYTIQLAVNPESTINDFSMPGHIFPLRAHEGGVLKRAGHTEASVDISQLSGCGKAAVICEIMNTDGTMARLPDLTNFANKHDFKIGMISDLIDFKKNERNSS